MSLLFDDDDGDVTISMFLKYTPMFVCVVIANCSKCHLVLIVTCFL